MFSNEVSFFYVFLQALVTFSSKIKEKKSVDGLEYMLPG